MNLPCPTGWVEYSTFIHASTGWLKVSVFLKFMSSWVPWNDP
jgi:hypothetical protein